MNSREWPGLTVSDVMGIVATQTIPPEKREREVSKNTGTGARLRQDQKRYEGRCWMLNVSGWLSHHVAPLHHVLAGCYQQDMVQDLVAVGM